MAEDGGFTLRDQVASKRGCAVSINFLLHPALTARLVDGGVGVGKDGVDILAVGHQGGLAPFIAPAGGDDGGWYSAGFGQKQAVWRFGYRGRLGPGETALTRFTFV
jgi:hypothetical protein